MNYYPLQQAPIYIEGAISPELHARRVRADLVSKLRETIDDYNLSCLIRDLILARNPEACPFPYWALDAFEEALKRSGGGHYNEQGLRNG